MALQQGEHSQHAVLLGGLTDGMLYAPYCEPLAEALGAQGWSTVHAQLSSSYKVRHGSAGAGAEADQRIQTGC
jgi:hypothetical protein